PKSPDEFGARDAGCAQCAARPADQRLEKLRCEGGRGDDPRARSICFALFPANLAHPTRRPALNFDAVPGLRTPGSTTKHFSAMRAELAGLLRGQVGNTLMQ